MMENKQNEPAAKSGSGRKIWLLAAVVALIVTAAAVAGLVGGGTDGKTSYLKIDTPYIKLDLPSELSEIITNDESVFGNVYTRAFHMNYGGTELPLWRVDFGDVNAGDWVGILKTDQGEIPVTMTVFAAGDEELAALGEEASRLYGECMQAYSVMLDGITSDPRFTSERTLAVGEDTDMKLTYWNVTLPDTMEVQEKNEGGNYEAVFSGEVAGEMVLMYRVCIGGEQAEALLGYYEINGTKQAVSVESFQLAMRESWSEDDYAAACRMMDTINHVIETITQSKQFSAEAE